MEDPHEEIGSRGERDPGTCPSCGSTPHRTCCGAGVLEGETCWRPDAPEIHEFIGSMLENLLVKTRGKIPAKLWTDVYEFRMAVGKHDLRRRGYD